MSDINKLIGKAQEQLNIKEARSERIFNRNAINNKKTSTIALAIALFSWSWHLWSPNLLTEDKIRNELETLALAAQESVFNYANRYHQLPPQLPDPSLRMIFQYRVIDAQAKPPEFVLEGQIENVTARWNSLEKRG